MIILGILASSFPVNTNRLKWYAAWDTPLGLFPPQMTGQAEVNVLTQTILFSFSMR